MTRVVPSLRPDADAVAPGAALAAWLGIVCIAVSTVAMAAWTWLAWPDPLIDFGRELYVPWQITQGRRLYVDVAYFNGPLSPHLNALWFALFGVSLRTLVVANLVIVALVLLLIYRLGGLIGGRIASVAGCLTFVGAFGFGQYVRTGNFNWVCPYSHEMTHGTALALAGVYCLWRYCRRRRARWLAASGLAVGLAFLTKVEISAAATAAVGAGVVAMLWVDRYSLAESAKLAGLWLACALAPPAAAWLLLSAAMPAPDAAVATLGSWAYAFDSANSLDVPFLRRGMGLEAPWANALEALAWACRYVAVLVPAAFLATFGRGLDRPRRWLAGAAGLVVGIPLVLCLFRPDWNMGLGKHLGLGLADIGRPLPLFMAVVAVAVAVQLIRRRARAESSGDLAPRLALVLFALLMLLKMALNARMYHYGFALAMPAAVVLVMVLASWPAQWIRSRGGYVPVYGVVFLVAFGTLLAGHIRATGRLMAAKVHTVGSGADAFRADVRGSVVDGAVRHILEHSGKDDTVAVLPEGIMLNYLARRAAPTPYVNLIPHEWNLYGPKRVEQSFLDNPASMVVLAQRDLMEYGSRGFGKDYAQGLFAWVKSNYSPTAKFSQPGGPFKIWVCTPRPAPAE